MLRHADCIHTHTHAACYMLKRAKLIALACAIVHITSRQNANHFWCEQRKKIVRKNCELTHTHTPCAVGAQFAECRPSIRRERNGMCVCVWVFCPQVAHHRRRINSKLIYCNFVGIFPINYCFASHRMPLHGDDEHPFIHRIECLHVISPPPTLSMTRR